MYYVHASTRRLMNESNQTVLITYIVFNNYSGRNVKFYNARNVRYVHDIFRFCVVEIIEINEHV